MPDSLKLELRVYRLPEDASSQQCLVERAEEDLLCAISLYRNGSCGYKPLVTVCYLLHQALEKWLKLFIAVKGIPLNAKTHDLDSRIRAIEQIIDGLCDIRKDIEEIDPKLMDHKFPGDLRYNDTPPEIDEYINVLMHAVFRVRKLIKKHLNQISEGPS